MFEILLQALGISTIAFVGISFLNLVYLQLTRGKNLKRYGAGTGAWAVVTGSSDGIGKAYATQLAAKKFNIVLLSRTEAKLKEVAQEIEGKYKVQTLVVTIDFAKATSADYDKIKNILSTLDIGILVNNVAISNEIPERFTEMDRTRMRDMVNININATNELTYIVLPLMVAKARGLIINIGSASGLGPTPLLSVYAGTKAYMHSWSETLSAEYAKYKIDIECEVPFFVVSNMSKRSRPSLTIPLPETYVAASLSKVGKDTLFSSYFIHNLMKWAISWLPKKFIINKNLSLHEDIRKRALAKQQKSQKKSE